MNVAVLHAAGYAGRELIGLLSRHPNLTLSAVTSRTFAGEPVSVAHPELTGRADLAFTTNDQVDPSSLDAIVVAAEHGQAAAVIAGLIDGGYEGVIVDLSADFRFKDAALYPTWFGREHPRPELLAAFTYGLVDVHAPYEAGTKWIANPGCFATGLSLALYPLGQLLGTFDAHVTALTGASGSGTRPKAGTHFPTREGNVRAYKVLAHQHLPEVQAVAGSGVRIHFVPVSGPWTRGIWGTVQVDLPAGVAPENLADAFQTVYANAPSVRLWPGQLPELRWSVRTPYCDLGWIVRDGHAVIGFGLDNLLKGAASQAVQNVNLALGLPVMAGM
ncbi:MAG: N-acetyl-gamma-glutamyl-phosphate reductase [Bacteroidota bacterium]